MNLKGISRATAKYYITAIMITAFVIFEAKGVDYSDLFVAVLTACLGTTGIMIYGDIKGGKNV